MSFHFDPATASAIGLLLGGISGIVTIGFGFINRVRLWGFFSEQVLLVKKCDELERVCKRLEQSDAAQEKTILAQQRTITLLESEIEELKAVKRLFSSLVGWIRPMLGYVAFLEGLVTPSQLGGRKMPPLPADLAEYVTLEVADAD